MARESAKNKVIQLSPQAYCVKLADKSGYIVWPGPVGPRGFVTSPIGLGKTPSKAWKQSLLAITHSDVNSDRVARAAQTDFLTI